MTCGAVDDDCYFERAALPLPGFPKDHVCIVALIVIAFPCPPKARILLEGKKLFTRITSVFLIPISLVACATAPSLKPIPAGGSVSIFVVANQKYPSVVDVRNTAIGEGVSVGAGSGGLAGGLWGLSCGPWAFFCVPLAAGLGMGVGGAAGLAVGATGMLPQEKVDRVKERLVRFEQSHPLQVELRRHLEERAQKYWTLKSESSTPLVMVELQEMKVDATRDEQLRFVFRISVSQRETTTSRELVKYQKSYEHATPYSPMAAWLDEKNDLLDTSFDNAMQQLAAQVIIDLAAK
jgi:hypothetical protein